MTAPVHTALIVEDDPATAALLADYVRSLGHAVRIAATLIIEKGEQGTRRLHPLVAVAPINWALFERHENPAITRIAAAEQKLR
jgi:CheY-like chemotaxis protein